LIYQGIVLYVAALQESGQRKLLFLRTNSGEMILLSFEYQNYDEFKKREKHLELAIIEKM
jgi:hypothetical protein